MTEFPALESYTARLLAVLQALARQIGHASDLAGLLSSAADMAHLQLGYEKVAVYLVDPVGGNLALCALAGADRSQIPAVRYHLPMGESTPGQAALWGRHSRVDDFAVNREATSALDRATVAELSVPIRDAGRAIGALTVASSCPAAYGPQDEEGLALLADQLAALVRAAELFR
ncbi:MAG: GAF domain-containing protein, partial [Chloroflexi bacterium]|nr:GAF domain-containing protein [Chloroflexota bacterium]